MGARPADDAAQPVLPDGRALRLAVFGEAAAAHEDLETRGHEAHQSKEAGCPHLARMRDDSRACLLVCPAVRACTTIRRGPYLLKQLYAAALGPLCSRANRIDGRRSAHAEHGQPGSHVHVRRHAQPLRRPVRAIRGCECPAVPSDHHEPHRWCSGRRSSAVRPHGPGARARSLTRSLAAFTIHTSTFFSSNITNWLYTWHAPWRRPTCTFRSY